MYVQYAACIPTEVLNVFLWQAEKAKAPIRPAGEDSEPVQDKAPRLRMLLGALTTFSESTTPELRSELVVELLVLTHHPRIANAEAGLWVDLLQTAHVAPDALIRDRLEGLLSLVFSDASTDPSVSEGSKLSNMCEVLRVFFRRRVLNLQKLHTELLQLWLLFRRLLWSLDYLLNSRTIYQLPISALLVPWNTAFGPHLKV